VYAQVTRFEDSPSDLEDGITHVRAPVGSTKYEIFAEALD